MSVFSDRNQNGELLFDCSSFCIYWFYLLQTLNFTMEQCKQNILRITIVYFFQLSCFKVFVRAVHEEAKWMNEIEISVLVRYSCFMFAGAHVSDVFVYLRASLEIHACS